MIKKIGLLCLLAWPCLYAVAQEKVNTKADSVDVIRDTTLVDGNRPVEKIVSYANKYDPRKALLYAAVLPGSGQIYNKKYWKLPLVYGGFGLLINAVSFYQTAYVKYKNQLFIRINGGVPPGGRDIATLRTIVDEARRQRDFFLVMSGLMYILQMVDAHVDAHLKEFDLNPKLRVQLKPQMEQNNMMGRSSGIALVFKF